MDFDIHVARLAESIDFLCQMRVSSRKTAKAFACLLVFLFYVLFCLKSNAAGDVSNVQSTQRVLMDEESKEKQFERDEKSQRRYLFLFFPGLMTGSGEHQVVYSNTAFSGKTCLCCSCRWC